MRECRTLWEPETPNAYDLHDETLDSNNKTYNTLNTNGKKKNRKKNDVKSNILPDPLAKGLKPRDADMIDDGVAHG